MSGIVRLVDVRTPPASPLNLTAEGRKARDLIRTLIAHGAQMRRRARRPAFVRLRCPAPDGGPAVVIVMGSGC